jgi:DNA replication protein DnaC
MRPHVLLGLKALRLCGMVGAWSELLERDRPLDSCRWLIEHLMQAEHADRAMRPIRNQPTSARFLLHRDLAGFQYEDTPFDRAVVQKPADAGFTETAHNVALVGGPGTGKTHLAIAIGHAAVTLTARVRASTPR